MRIIRYLFRKHLISPKILLAPFSTEREVIRLCKSLANMGLILIILFTLFVSSAHAVVSTLPSSVNVARGQSTSVTITYAFSGVVLDGTWTSQQGFFTPNFGTVDVPLSVTIQNGTGRVSETITISPAVVERAFKAGSGTFIYTRAFIPLTGGLTGTPMTATETAKVNIRITPETIAEFSLRRIELYFNGKEKKSEAVVNRNFKELKAHADIYFNGSGFLQGYWEVDGRVIERISRYVSFGAKVSLITPNMPGLPTFEPGFHSIRFVVTNPQPPFELPQILYWVTAREEPVKRTLSFLRPKDGAEISEGDEFRWEKMEGVSVYLVTFIKKDDRTIVFSALTPNSSYKIPQSVISQSFTKDTKYIWQVKGFDGEGNIVAGSEERSMRLK